MQGYPAPSNGSKKRSTPERNATKTMIAIGALSLAVLVFLPIWNSINLIKDPVYTYFAGGASVPKSVFVCSIAVWAIGFLTVNRFFVKVPFEALTEQAIISVAIIFLTLLGVVLTLHAQPLDKQAKAAYSELWNNCENGARTRPLYAVQQHLMILRNDSTCAAQQSVEKCNSFKDYPYMAEARVLKAMEDNLGCSGFCYKPESAVNSTIVPYPPTLFSLDNHQASCDGAAARHVRLFVSSSAGALMHEGVFLILVAASVGLMKLLGLCIKKEDSDVPEKVAYDYGAL